jgi:hypothetical protein
MPEPAISPTAPPVVATTNGTQQDQFFGPQMEEALNEAFATARPEEFKPKTITAPAREAQKTPAEEVDAQQSASEVKPDRPAGAPEVKAPVKAAQWKEVNEERARLKEENAKFKAEQEKYAKEQEKWKSWETERNEFESVKKRNEELTRLMKEVALDRLPEFKKHFDDRRNTALAIGQQIVGQEHAETLKKIAQLPDGDFRNQLARGLMENLDEFQKAELGPVLTDIRKINFERQAALEKAPENLTLYEQTKAKQRKEEAEKFQRTFDDRLQKWSDPEKGLALFQKKDGDEAHNAEVQKRIDHARNILNMNLSADEFSKAALWASAAPGLLQDLLASREREKQKDAELEALKAGGPELQGGGGEESVDQDKQYEGMDAGAIIADMAKKAGGWQ